MKPINFLSIIGMSILLLITYFLFEDLNDSKNQSHLPIVSSSDYAARKNEVKVDNLIDKKSYTHNYKSKIPNIIKKSRNTCFELEESTIALWRFNGDYETSFKNEKNNIFGKFIGNPTSVKGKFGNAIHFDGIDDYGNCNFNPPEKNCTYEIWYKPDEVSDKNGWVWMGWGLYNSGLILNQNKVALCEFNAKNKKKEHFTINPNDWNYIVYVFSDNPEMQALYINGEKITNLEISRHEPTWNTLWLAADMTFGANHFVKGTIDEFRISDKVMTEKEIKKCWNKNK
ncbi:MAG: hypothetical protein RLZ10_1637 [Bacteroidota bacterium]|jgi:hypothetical protein